MFNVLIGVSGPHPAWLFIVAFLVSQNGHGDTSEDQLVNAMDVVNSAQSAFTCSSMPLYA